MKVMRADGFTGYGDLKLTELPKPKLAPGQVLVRMAAAGVTPLEHTILMGHFPLAKAPLVLGSEGAGVIEEGGDSQSPNGTRVMFCGAFGVFENGTYSQYLAVPRSNLCPIPDNVDIHQAASIPVAYSTAYMALRAAGFQAGKTVLSPAIGGSVANAVTQLAVAMGAKHAISTTTNHEKAEQAKKAGFSDVIDLTQETITEGVRRITGDAGVDIIIDEVGGDILSEALGTLAQGGSLTTLGYAKSREATINVTNLIWKGASIKSFLLFNASPEMWAESWTKIVELLKAGKIKPIIAKAFELSEAPAAIKYLVEGRPFGRVILKM